MFTNCKRVEHHKYVTFHILFSCLLPCRFDKQQKKTILSDFNFCQIIKMTRKNLRTFCQRMRVFFYCFIDHANLKNHPKKKYLCNFNLECCRQKKDCKKKGNLVVALTCFSWFETKITLRLKVFFLQMQLNLKGDFAINILQGNVSLPLYVS